MKKEAATLSVRVARHLLRRTRLLKKPRQAQTPVAQRVDNAAVPETQAISAPTAARPLAGSRPRDDELAQLLEEMSELRARVQRAETAAAWLRARLRAERVRRAPLPQFDATALAADLVRELHGLHTPHPEAIRRVVYRTLAAHGLPVSQEAIEGRGGPTRGAVLWPREQQEVLAAAVLARTPEVADPAYIYRVLALLAERGRLTLPDLVHAAGYSSAMARRRLRLAVEALAALGALTIRDGAYALNAAWTPPTPPRETRGAQNGRNANRSTRRS